jgi:hypothetical protein
MKLSKLKTLIREEASSAMHVNEPINEGVVDKIVAAIVDKIIKTKYKKYFDELHSDPEYIEALKGIKTAASRIEASGDAYEKAKINQQKEYDTYVRKYGKAAADKIVADVKAGTYRYSWKKHK